MTYLKTLIHFSLFLHGKRYMDLVYMFYMCTSSFTTTIFPFLLEYIHCMGEFIVTILNKFTLYIGWITPSISPYPATLSLIHLKQSQEISSFYFAYVYEAPQPYSLTFISSIHPHPPTSTPGHAVPIL
jgi:hypothetical protein